MRGVLDCECAEIEVFCFSARMFSRELHTSLPRRGMATVIRPFSLLSRVLDAAL